MSQSSRPLATAAAVLASGAALAAAVLASRSAAAAAAVQSAAQAALLGADLAPLQPGLDYHSFANTDQFVMTRLDLDLRVDSKEQVLRGVVGLQVKRLDPSATELVLDTRDLTIAEVSQKAQDVLGATSKSETTWISRPFHFEKKDPILGSALVIELPPSRRPSEFIRIEYQTSPSASALQWLTDKQTGHGAFLYTESEPIGARSWIPLQDTPQVRVTYKAFVHTSRGELAVMSARNDPNAKRNGEYAFVMPDAIPPYLIALAVGDLKFQPTGPRTGVYAQGSIIKEAAREFADVESMIQAGERIAGPYRWERYDLLVLPPSFPEGGMENPRVAFITPTAIAGDKSLAPLVAQQLAHAWSGNLVGNATWRDAWLNEGISQYLGSRIVNALYGEGREMMERVLGLQSLREALTRLEPADQALAIDLRGRDPIAAFSDVPYEKGRLFLTYLDAKFGRERFDAFLQAYFERYEFKTIDTPQFMQYLQDNLLDRYPGIVSLNEVAAWVNGPGLPPDAVLPATDAFAPVDSARSAWLAGAPAKTLNTRDWTGQQWTRFLDGMPATLTAAQMAELDHLFKLDQSSNALIVQSWCMLVARNHYQPGNVRLENYLQTIGRIKLIRPLYEELMKTPAGSVQAERVYRLARPGYHPQAVAAIDAIVHPSSEAAEATDE